MKFKFYFLVLFLIFNWSAAQIDLLQEIDTAKVENIYQTSFKALQIVTAQSTKLSSKNQFYIIIAHRFGDLSTGFKDFFGLDDASTKLGVIYGVTDEFSLSISRETFMKTFEFGAKYRLLQQKNNSPFDIVGCNVIAINSDLSKDDYPNINFGNRLSYLTQILVSRRFNDRISLQLMPSYIHKNLYDASIENNNQFLVGIGGRHKISKRISFNAEYFVKIDNFNYYKNPLSVGMDIETGGHVFQLVFSNSQVNSDIGYLTNAAGDWGKGNIYFGFNLYRVF